MVCMYTLIPAPVSINIRLLFRIRLTASEIVLYSDNFSRNRSLPSTQSKLKENQVKEKEMTNSFHIATRRK